MKIRKWFEILLIKIAISILRGRNATRSAVVSRKDNNEMYYMSEKLESVCKRMQSEYKE